MKVSVIMMALHFISLLANKRVGFLNSMHSTVKVMGNAAMFGTLDAVRAAVRHPSP